MIVSYLSPLSINGSSFAYFIDYYLFKCQCPIIGDWKGEPPDGVAAHGPRKGRCPLGDYRGERVGISQYGRGARREAVGGIGPKVRTFRRLSLEGTSISVST